MSIKQNAQINYFQNLEAQSSVPLWITTVKFRGIQPKKSSAKPHDYQFSPIEIPAVSPI